jgi:hypothetical protein
MKYVLLISLFLCACQRPVRHIVDIDPAFQGYVNEFVAESINQGRPISITNLIIAFSDELGPSTIGRCFYYSSDQPNKILINKQDWPYESDEYRRVTLFHELGHCVLGRPHLLNGSIYNGYCSATSIMWPQIENTTDMYSSNWDEYMHELFIGSTTAPSCAFTYWAG